MTSTIKVNTITTESGSTLTVGGCGKTVALASGASQTGFGRTGTVDWQTTKKTLAFTAANGEGYFVDTAASGAVTMTLPASPSAGNIVAVKDYNGNFATANLTIARNGSPINGANSADVIVNTDGASIVLVYVDATQGWVATQDDASTFAGEAFIEATGGNTVATCGNDKIHTFTGPGTFAVSQAASCATNNKVSYLVIAGGGGAGHSFPTSNAGGGGGAGGYREVKNPVNPFTASPLDGFPTPANVVTVTATSFPITVGGGGPGATGTPGATSGSPSIFSTITAAGGGRGAANGPGTPTAAATGGSGGGGAGGTSCASIGTGAAGNTPPVTPAQGNSGGTNYKVATGNPPDNPGAGGGGAGAAAPDAPTGAGGNGGAGTTSSINGTPTARAGGGAGGGSPNGTGGTGGGGGTGQLNATDNTGGGGGGTMNGTNGGNGASGIVIIRYRFQ